MRRFLCLTVMVLVAVCCFAQSHDEWFEKWTEKRTAETYAVSGKSLGNMQKYLDGISGSVDNMKVVIVRRPAQVKKLRKSFKKEYKGTEYVVQTKSKNNELTIRRRPASGGHKTIVYVWTRNRAAQDVGTAIIVEGDVTVKSDK